MIGIILSLMLAGAPAPLCEVITNGDAEVRETAEGWCTLGTFSKVIWVVIPPTDEAPAGGFSFEYHLNLKGMLSMAARQEEITEWWANKVNQAMNAGYPAEVKLLWQGEVVLHCYPDSEDPTGATECFTREISMRDPA